MLGVVAIVPTCRVDSIPCVCVETDREGLETDSLSLLLPILPGAVILWDLEVCWPSQFAGLHSP